MQINVFQIVRHDRTMEQIVFPVPNICEYLTRESKCRVFNTTERDEQGSKVNDFSSKLKISTMRYEVAERKSRSKFIEPKWSESIMKMFLEHNDRYTSTLGYMTGFISKLALKFLPSDVTEITYKLKHVSSVCSWSQDTCGLEHRRFWLIRSSFSADPIVFTNITWHPRLQLWVSSCGTLQVLKSMNRPWSALTISEWSGEIWHRHACPLVSVILRSGRLLVFSLELIPFFLYLNLAKSVKIVWHLYSNQASL